MNYFSKLFSTGAVRETPKKVIETLLNEVKSLNEATAVEIGAGKGELTNALLKKKDAFSTYYAFEIDEKACVHLQKHFPQVIIKKHNAFEFADHLPNYPKIDLFLSSIPLSFYPRKKINELSVNIKQRLSDNGIVVIVFTAFWLIPILKKQFPNSKVHRFLTFPPYFLLIYHGSANPH